jgi:hypothetical protein
MKMIAAIFGLLVVLMWDLTQNDSRWLRYGLRAALDMFRFLGF